MSATRISPAREGLGPSPLYRCVITRITERLATGEWRSGDAIPSESRLAEQFQVSIGTIRKAIDELVAEKILVRQQGRGTFVAVHTEDRFLYYFFHVVGPDGVKRFPKTKLLSLKRSRADAATAGRMKLARGARTIQIQNLLMLDDQPVVLDDIIVPVELFRDLNEDIFRSRPGTIYHLYQERYGLNVIRTVERLRAVAADAVTASALGVRKGSPVLEIDRTAYSYNDLPVELRRSRINTVRHAYLNYLGRQP